jgi:hypothetical protein
MDGTPTDQSTANGDTVPTSSIPNYQDISCRPNGASLAFNSLFDVATLTAATGANNRCLTLSPTSFNGVNPNFDSTTNSPGPPNFPYPDLGGRGEATNHPEVIGDDLLLTNVVSFTVRVLPAGQYDFVDLQGLPGTSATAPFVYDTGLIGSASGPAYRISALEITIRVWDVKTQQTRQLTIIQDMGGLMPPSKP